ncbi:MAG: uroporphyrinogen decarboxylase family protein [Planctomycetota bacterium]|jgi:uroporphyrinogen decarboxylase
MTGVERVINCFDGLGADVQPVLPMVHAGLAGHLGISLGEFFTDARAMSRVMVEGYRRFGFDGIQLSLGVTGEAEALGAKVDQPPEGGPVLREHLLSDPGALDKLQDRDVVAGGRMPLFFEAVERVSGQIGSEAFILATLRGPLVIASQLRGVEDVLIDMIEGPAVVDEILGFATEVALQVGGPSLAAGAHGLLLGEATCSPNFISPGFYRRFVQPHHRRLVAGLKEMGWPYVGLHVCGNIVPIIEDLILTGVDFLDVDYQVSADRAIELVGDRVCLRGNLDPISVLHFGTPDEVGSQTESLCQAIGGRRWIISSGCDIPPGTSAENLTALVESVHRHRS